MADTHIVSLFAIMSYIEYSERGGFQFTLLFTCIDPLITFPLDFLKFPVTTTLTNYFERGGHL